ncbi:MAG: protein kinase [Magnetococcales bacterium]|nr:protein kinase [Magnetococcales bacterium]
MNRGTPALTLPEGHMFHEYEILKIMGQGGFGVTYLARDIHLDKKVAIKEFFPRQFSHRDGISVWPNTEASVTMFSEWKRRFLDEARILAMFQHPNIVRVLRFFEAHGTAYMVMEFEDGVSLKEWVKSQDGRVSEAALLRLLKPLLSGLDKMHKAQILHRDIKPDNIFIRSSDGMPVLLDFGAARQSVHGQIQNATAIYTPGFAPIEQYSNSHFDQGPWTDIHALASVLYWVITGKRPPDAMLRWQTVNDNSLDPLVPLLEWRDQGYQEAFLRAVEHGLSLHPRERPQSISQWQAELFGELVLHRVYISAPRDVTPERVIVQRVVERLQQEFGSKVLLEAVYWERDSLFSTRTWKTYVRPSQSDTMVVILWSRIESGIRKSEGVVSRAPVLAETGIDAPTEEEIPTRINEESKILVRERTIDSGTEWEFADAVAAQKIRGRPDLLVFKKNVPIRADLENWAVAQRIKARMNQVDEFIGTWFRDASLDPIQAELHPFEHVTRFEDMLEQRLRELLRERFGSVAGDANEVAGGWSEGSPFRGLESFDPEHARVFHGRTQARHELRDILVRRVERQCAFVLVLGASGSGKSSLVKAGLLPDLMTPGVVEHVALCRYAILCPGDNPTDLLEALAAAMLSRTALPELASTDFSPNTLIDALRLGAPDGVIQTVRFGLHKAGETAHLSRKARAVLLIIVDQFEELFTLDGITSQEREAFVAVLETLARSGLCWVVATMRSDFFHRLAALPNLKKWLPEEARYLLLPPAAAEIGQMIRHPAREAGLRFDTDPETGTTLDEILLQAVGDNPHALPLLEFTLEQLWQQRTEQGVLPMSAYRAMGGLEGSLGQRAEAVHDTLPAAVREKLFEVFRILVTVEQDESSHATARTVAMSVFPERHPWREIVQAYLAARLLVVYGNGERAQIRIAHEALLTHWARIRKQIQIDRQDIQTRARLEQAATRWHETREKDRDALLLAPGLPLSEAEDLLHRRRHELCSGIVTFIESSSHACRRMLAEKDAAQKRKIRRTRLTMATMGVLLVLAMVGGWLAWRNYLIATENFREARHLARMATKNSQEIQNQLRKARQNQSSFLAERALAVLEKNQTDLALNLVLAALPRGLSNPDWPLVPGAVNALSRIREKDATLAVLRGHEDVVDFATLSPDGKWVVTASWDRTARIWDARSGAEVVVLRGHEHWVNSVVFNRDGTRVITASLDNTSRVWNTQNGTEVAVLHGLKDWVNSAVFSPDGTRVVMALHDRTARIWDAQSGTEMVVIRGHEDRVNSAVFSPDGTRVVTASHDKTARVWDVERGTEVAVLRGHVDDVYSATFNPDGTKVVTMSQDKTARIWNAGNGARVALLRGHEKEVISAAFSPDGTRVITISLDKTARLWDAGSGAEVVLLHGHEGRIKSAEFSPDGTMLVTAADDSTARVWDARSGTGIVALRGHKGWINSAVFSPDGTQIVTTSDDKTVRVWNARSGTEITALYGHENPVNSAAFFPDGTRVISKGKKTVRIWNVQSSSRITATIKHPAAIESVAFSPDGEQVVMASQDNTLRVLKVQNGAEIAVLRGHEKPVKSTAFCPDGSRVVTASDDKTVRVWNAQSGAMIAHLHGHTDPVHFAAFSPNGIQVVSASHDRTVRVWRVADGTEMAVLRGHGKPVQSAAFSPDGTRVVTASWDNTARVWDVQSGAEMVVLSGHEGEVYSAAFSPDGAQIVTASWDGTARVWDARSGTGIVTLHGHEKNVNSATFSPDGSQVVTASEDKTARVWDVQSGAEIATLRGHSESVLRATFSPDGTKIHTFSWDKTTRVWDVSGLNLANLLSVANVSVLRPLTRNERKLNFLARESENDSPGRSENHAHLHDQMAGDRFRFSHAESHIPSQAIDATQQATRWWNGEGVPQMRQTALRLWQQGADLGDPVAHQRLGWLYELGREGVVPVDLEKALFHYAVATHIFEQTDTEKKTVDVMVRRASLARILPMEVAARAAQAAQAWQPSVPVDVPR